MNLMNFTNLINLYMTQPLTSDQINQLESLGIEVKKETPFEDLKIKNLKSSTIEHRRSKSSIFPLLSISGLTILSFSGLLLLKNKDQNSVSPSTTDNRPSTTDVTPTQVPKSIQHYLLTSQQYFSRALQLQSSQNSATAGSDQSQTIDLLNQSILASTQAIKEFPQDYRGYLQRAQIYQSLVDSKPEFLSQAITDLNSSYKLNSNSSEITHLLASLYAKKGDIPNTLSFLNQTIIIEPTKAQNFYDLAKIQQQAGLLPQALETYNKLLTLVSDSTQKIQVEAEKSALEKLVAQNPNIGNNPVLQNPSTIDDQSPAHPAGESTISLDSPLIQALADSSLIVAAPETENKVEISNQTESNSLAGNSTLSSGQKQIVISNTNISSSSQVYVTITKGGKNQNLQVLSKSNGSFIVGLDSPINEDIEFKWWIIN